jgi:uncharacterized membrane protein
MAPRQPHARFDVTVFVCVTFAVLLGVGFRFSSLNAPLFWQDEAFTALRATGHLEADYMRLFDGRIHPVAQIRALESVDVTRGVPAVVHALGREDPHHSPLYYALCRLWVGVFGTTPAGFRSLSATLGCAGILLMFFLATTLFGSRSGGAVAASIFALSPIFVLYARQAREYALFADATLLGTFVFLSALRRPSVGIWTAYALTVAIALYVDPIFILVVVAHGTTIVLETAGRLARLRAWAIAASAGAICFLPWALNAVRSKANIVGQLDWGRTAYPFKYLLLKWGFNLGALGFDAEFRSIRLAPLAALVIVAIFVSLVSLARPQARPVARVVVPLAGTTLIVLVARDAIFNSHFELTVRYLTPMWIALILAGAAAIARGLATPRLRAVASIAWAGVLVTGAAAAFVRGGAENWWDNNDQIAFQQMARDMNRTSRPLVLSQDHPHPALVLARYLRDDAEFLLFRNVPPRVPTGRHAFVVAPSPDVLAALASASRGSYVLANVSPVTTTAIAGFHKGLWHAAPAIDRGDYLVFVPQNALWALEPVSAHQAKTGL